MADELTFTQLQGPTEFTVKASAEGGRLLLFKGAILARAERNRNGDEISPKNIQELVATLPGTPIDIEHKEQEIIGMFTDSRPTEDGTAVSVDGLIFMDRFPDEAADVQSGRRPLSVEADAEEAECSDCGKRFRSSREYCPHLTARKKSSTTSRRFHNMTAKGGAVTRRPAGSRTNFDPSQIRIIASHTEKDEPMKCPHCQASIEEEAEKCKDCGKNVAVGAIVADLNAALALAKTLETERDTALASVKSTADTLETTKAEVTEKETALVSKEGELTAAQAKVGELTSEIRRQRIAAHLDDKEWESQKNTVMAMADEAFDLYANGMDSAAKKANEKGGAGLRVPEPVAGRSNHKTKEGLSL